MFEKSISGKKSNDLQNGFENELRILRGEAEVERLCLQDILGIVEYGWDPRDLQKMLDEEDYAGIGILAAYIRECGNGCSGFIVEDDPYVYPLDEDGGSMRVKYQTLNKLIDYGLIREDEQKYKHNAKPLFCTELGNIVCEHLEAIHEALPYRECTSEEYK